MKKIIQSFSLTTILFLSLILFIIPSKLEAQHPSYNNNESSEAYLNLGNNQISDVSLLNQDGETIQLSKLIKEKVVAINFIYTTCKTICPPMGANFVHLKEIMGEHVDKDLLMLSVSIDPDIDTPQRLKQWSEKFNPGTGWTLLTGSKKEVDALLKALEVYTPLKEDLAPILIIGKAGEDGWIRMNGLADPNELATVINGYLGKTVISESKHLDKIALNYFTNTVLINQYGEEMKFYEDLLANKIVVINPFFSECTGSCPIMHKNMQQIQEYLGDRLGKDVNLISITVDPENDRPEGLREYAKRFKAKRGWYFLSGSKENVEFILKKMGKYVNAREEHDNIFLIGNNPTKLWKKVNGLANPQEIIELVESVVNDNE